MSDWIKESIQIIPTNTIFSHPDNPRKEVGDITELTSSIKKNGLMQNLTVVPATDVHHAPPMAKYILLIGHRRFAAATAAGITEVPCRVIEGLSAKEQVGIMLEENMQRSDLTVLEQADGFQMMLDLGDTVDDIADKTGFSKTTVYHRVNIAKLDKAKVEEAINNYQLTITDLIELEKIESIEKRNEILENVRDSANLKYRVKQELDRIERMKERDTFEQRLKAAGYTEPPKDYENSKWSNKWERKYIRPEEYRCYEITDEYKYYELDNNYGYLVKEAAEKKTELTPEEIEKKEKEEHDKAVRESNVAIKERITEQITDFIGDMIREDNVDKQNVAILWRTIVNTGGDVGRSIITDAIEKIFDLYDDEEIEKKLKFLGTESQMLCVIYCNIDYLINYVGKASYPWEKTDHIITHQEDEAKKVKEIIENILKSQGFELEEKAAEYINGTHSIYSE